MFSFHSLPHFVIEVQSIHRFGFALKLVFSLAAVVAVPLASAVACPTLIGISSRALPRAAGQVHGFPSLSICSSPQISTEPSFFLSVISAW